jgi:hypothetical protein
VFFGVIHATQN